MGKKDPYKFNLSKCAEKCVFLNKELKDEIDSIYKVDLFSLRTGSKFTRYLSISQIRNITMHPEDDLHKLLTEQLDYKSVALITLDLAVRVHLAKDSYYSKQRTKPSLVSDEKVHKILSIAN